MGNTLSMAEDKTIVCLGIMVADLVGGPLHALPKRGTLVLVDKMGLFPGGCAVNTATALVRLGLPASVIGKVGHDSLGDFMLDTLSERGVDVQGVRRDPETGTATTMVMLDPDGERRFIHYLGANANLVVGDVDFDLVEKSAILHIAGCFIMPGIDGEPTAGLLKRARSAGVTTFLDTAWDAQGRWMKLLAPVLPHLDYIVPSLAEARAITGFVEPADVAKALLDSGVGTVALKMGAAGCLVMTGDGRPRHFPAYQVNVVDATGAGDAFAAGFIAGVYLGWSIEQTARLANAVGALCVTGMGAQGGVSSLSKTLAFMEGMVIKEA